MASSFCFVIILRDVLFLLFESITQTTTTYQKQQQEQKSNINKKIQHETEMKL